ncbi:MAG: DUF3108 domain-containing protein [Methanoregula sp.]|nr:DUF3108 domain-containing protein [Methanoregula sp.]
MKREIVTILLVTTAVLFAGCTSQDEPVVPEQVQKTITPVSTSYETVAITTVHQPVTTVQISATKSTAKVFNGEYHWVEYRQNNSVTMPPNPRSSWIYNIKLEKSTSAYKGTAAIHYKITTISDYPECCINETVTITRDGSVFVEDTYFDASIDKFLGGTLSRAIKGVAQSPEEYTEDNMQFSPGASPGGWMGFSPFSEMNITLTDQGTESVTVPAGTYRDTQKYSGKFHDGTPITFWVAPGVPVPVRYEFPNKYLDGVDPFEVYELKAWK